jgi:hypothetical protein
MEKNIGKTDRLIRIILGLVSLYLAYAYNIWWLVLTVIALVTAIKQKCPLYSIFKKKAKPSVKQANKKKK